jgi:WD40 repeat protein
VSGSGRGRVCYVDMNDFDNIKVQDFPTFERLTSVHTNCTNSKLLLSGYSTSVTLFDMEKQIVCREFKEIHNDHINISRFCNTSPHIFSTSSFDGTIKTWDLRLPGPPLLSQPHWIPGDATTSSCGPINTLKCNTGIVTIHFSADDTFLIASALDNEINQFSFADGRLNFRYDIPSKGLDANFTRAYFSASGRYTLTGSCEESTVKFLSSYTGELLDAVDIYPNKRDPSLYIQVRILFYQLSLLFFSCFFNFFLIFTEFER